MAWTFLRVYFDQSEAWEALGDAERGRLLLAALQYAACEKLPEFRGNERYQWPMIKAQIDRERMAYLGKVKQCSEAGKASAESRQRERPSTVVNENQRPLTKEQEQYKTIQDNTRHSEEKKAKEKKTDAFEVFAGENAELLKALRDFEEMRKGIKHPLSDAAKDRLLSKLGTFPDSQWIQILDQSILNSWQDIYPLKDQKDRVQQKQKPYTTSAEYNARPAAGINVDQLNKIKQMMGGGKECTT